MFTLNSGQSFVVREAVKWFYDTNSTQVFQFDGPPGSGKSVVLNEIIKELGLDPLTEIAAMSFIGSASLVMRMKGLMNAKTAHSWIYDIQSVPARDKDGKILMDNLMNVPIRVPKFIPIEFLDPNIKLIVIDEAYSMPRKMRPTIEKFGIKIIACGDQGQLPPVNDEPAFLVDGNIYHLTEIMRQIGREDINYITERVRNGLPLLNGFYGNTLVIDYEDLNDKMLIWADMVICCKNSTRDYFNNRIRNLLGYTSKLPQFGEKVVCRKNNWLEGIQLDNGSTVNLVNGLIGTVTNSPDISSYDGNLFSLDFCPDLVPSITFQNCRCN